jgi:ferrous iron transport protein A
MSGQHNSNGETLFCTMVRKILGARSASRDLASFGPPDVTGHIEMPLSYLAPGEKGHVLGLRGDPETRQHLLEMGFTVGTPIDFLRIAPLGDPITVRVRGYHLSLRRQEADAIWMRRCPPELAGDLAAHEPLPRNADGSTVTPTSLGWTGPGARSTGSNPRAATHDSGRAPGDYRRGA